MLIFFVFLGVIGVGAALFTLQKQRGQTVFAEYKTAVVLGTGIWDNETSASIVIHARDVDGRVFIIHTKNKTIFPLKGQGICLKIFERQGTGERIARPTAEKYCAQ